MEHPTKVVLLDLDGTLTKSDSGILSSAIRTYKKLGKPVPTDEELSTFVGPPLSESFTKHGLADVSDEAVRLYREAYTTPTFDDPLNPGGEKIPGMFLNEVYDGIPEALKQLRERGYFLALATCKPEPQARLICERFHLTELMDDLFGASLDNTRIHKAQVIRYGFDRIHFDEERGDRAVMVGDRWTDVDGGHYTGVKSIGCRWGFAAPGELEEHGADMIIDTTDELPDAVDRFFATF